MQRWRTCALDWFGSGEHFCLAKKLGSYTHCGVPAHAKGTCKKNKAKVVVDAYYVPGGTILQRPTAKVDPMIRQVDVPAKYISIFRTSRLTTAKWKDLIINTKTDIGDSEREDDDSKPNKGAEDKEMEEDDGSIPLEFDKGEDYMTETEMTEEAFKITWDCSLSQVGGDADWAPTAQAHRAAIDLLGSLLNSSTKRHIACIKALNARADLGSQEATNISRQLRQLLQVVHEHRTLAESVNAALEAGHASAESLEDLKGEMDNFVINLNTFSSEAKVTSESILKMITLFRKRAQTREDNIQARILQIELVIGGFPRPSSPPALQHQLFNQPSMGDTPLGTTIVGGTGTILTANMLFSLVPELQVKVDMITERAEHNGVLFDGITFNSESELSVWFALHNPSGAGCAAMVDFQSIWAYAELDAADSSAWLSNMEKSRKMGLKGGRYKAMYMHSMGMKYPSYFVGKATNITSTRPSRCWIQVNPHKGS